MAQAWDQGKLSVCPPDALNYIYFDLKSEFSFFCLLKGITTEKPNPPSDSKDENGNETKKPSPPRTPLQKIVKSPPSTKQNSKIPSIKCINYIFFFFRKVSQQKNQIRPQIARTRMETKLKSHAHLLRHPKKSWNRRRRQNETAKFRQ